MKRTIALLMIFLGGLTAVRGEGILFFEGSYAEALEKARLEGKMVFIDFYADWCGPCRTMATGVFTEPEVGDYFNRHFVALKVDTENPDNDRLVKQFKVKSLPTMLFITAEGKTTAQLLGAMPVADFLRQARVATGESPGFEALYNKMKSSKNDPERMQQVLMAAPSFVSALENNMEKEKWIVRINRLFREYTERKMGPALINATDYTIITTFHQPDKPGDKIMEFINAHVGEYLEKVGQGPAYYVIEYNDRITGELARNGKMEYKKYLERAGGDMKEAYGVLPKRTVSPLESNTLYYDAEYELFYKKDAPRYIQLMEEYFKTLGEAVSAMNYGGASQKIYQATGGKVSDEVIRKAMEWTLLALQFTDIPVLDKLNYLVMLGDSHKSLKEYEQARKYYNQAYMEAMQVDMEMTRTMVQMKIKQKLAALEME